MQRDATFPLLLLCFFLSGLAGLVYETAWTREFAFVFGTSNLAVATVLAAYMGGLAAGAAAAARFAYRVRRPVLVYGLLEFGIGVSALAVPFAIQASRSLYVALFGGRSDLPDVGGLPTAFFYLVCSFAILLVPTSMMGATLPLLARQAVRHTEEIGSRIGLLYAVNTAGAVGGTLLAAFVLLPVLGLGHTIGVAAGINGLVFAAAWALARSAVAVPVSTTLAERRAATGGVPWILLLIFGSGVVSFTYEILWVRLLDHLLGGSVYAFATMLASFLLGIALGSVAASHLATTRSRATAGFTFAQLGIAGLSLTAFVSVGWIPSITDSLRTADVPKQLVDAAAAMLTLFPASLCIGATFPFAVRAFTHDPADAGPASGRVFAANTAGSIVGAIAAGFFVVPALGFAGTAIACALGNFTLAGAAALLLAPRRVPLAALAALVASILFFVRPGTPWRVIQYSSLAREVTEGHQIEYLGVGRAATVLLTSSMGRWLLRTNGNPEGAIAPPGMWHHRSLLEPWLTALPVLARPDARSLLVVGFGAGRALEGVPRSVERIDVVELEPEVVAANRVVASRRWRDPLADPRLRIHLNDARNALLLTQRRFDAIVSQPSHPWSAGASHLYTSEFFRLAKSRLEEGGVFVQWIGFHFVDELLFRSLLATLGDVFANVRVYSPTPRGGALFIASDGELDIESSAGRAIGAAPDDFARLGIVTPEDVTAWWILDETGGRALGAGAPLNRDRRNHLASRAPRILDAPLGAGVWNLVRPYDPIAKNAEARFDPFYLIRRLRIPAAKRLAQGLTDPVDRRVAAAWLRIRRGDAAGAKAVLLAVLEEAPRNAQARGALLGLSISELRAGGNPADLVAPPLDPAEAAVVAGWRAQAGEDVTKARALEPALAAVPPLHPLALEASRLRVRWRIASREPDLSREAMDIADQRIWERGRPGGDLMLRAEASTVAGEYAAALEALLLTAPALDDSVHSRGVAQRGLQILAAIPVEPGLENIRQRVVRQLRERAR